MPTDPAFTMATAQRDMRDAWAGGAPGVLASALAWLVAAAVALQAGEAPAVLALLVGGALIHPLGMLIAKATGRSARHAPANPLGALALESVAVLLVGCVLAYVLSVQRPGLFFPAMLLIIAGRYALFQTLYGLRFYWLLAAVLGLAGFGLFALRAPATICAGGGGVLEAVAAAALFRRAREEASRSARAVRAGAPG